MNEIFDKLLIRIILCALIFLILYSYRYMHFLFFKKIKHFSLRSIYPEKNLPHALFLVSRLVGFVLILGGQTVELSNGLLSAVFNLLFDSGLLVILYLISIYVFESIVLYSFTIEDEIIRRKNLSFSIVSSGLSLSAALIVSSISEISEGSLFDLSFLWLLTLVLFGLSTKLFDLIFKFNLTRSIVQHHLPSAFHYIGFIAAWVIILSSIINHKIIGHQEYILKTLLDMVLNVIIFPIFYIGVSKLFYINKFRNLNDNKEEQISSFGTFEGLLLFTSAILTVMITAKIQFGSFYPTL